MMNRATYNEIKEGIKSKLYKTIRLVKKSSQGDPDEVLIGFSQIKTGEEHIPNAIKRLDHFKKLLDTKFEPGQYEVQAKGSFIHSRTVSFPVTVHEKSITISDKKNTDQVEDHLDYSQLDDDEFMDKEEFKKMCREMESLRGQVVTLTLERDWYLKQLSEKEKSQGLADKSSWQHTLTELAKDVVPGMVNLTEKFISMRESQLADKKEEKRGKIRIKKKQVQINPDQAISYYSNLLNSNEEQGNYELDLLEEQNPDLYKTVSEALWPEEDEEEYLEDDDSDDDQYEEEDEEGYEGSEQEEEEPTGT